MFEAGDPFGEDSGEDSWSEIEWPAYDGPVEDLPRLPDSLSFLAGPDTLTAQLEEMLTEPVTPDTTRTLALMGPMIREPQQKMLHAAVMQRVEAAASAHALQTRVDAARPSGSGWTNDAQVREAELALVLRRTDNAMQADLTYGRRLETALPVTQRLYATGDLTGAHVRAIDRATEHLPEELAQTVDASIAPRGVTMTVAAFRRLARQAAAAAQPSPTEAHAKAKRTCGARWYPGEHGMGNLVLTMPATDGVAALHSLHRDATAAKTDGDDRTHGMRLVDAFLAKIFGAPAPAATTLVDASHAPPAPPLVRRRAEIQVTIDLNSLLGLREHPGDLAGHGPIPAQAVRELLAQPGSVLRRLIYDSETGVLRDYATSTYPADTLLRRLLETRDVTCRAPGCVCNAIWCDTEHRDAFDEGGASSCANCGLMCRKHHNLKTHKGFSYKRVDTDTGEVEWVTPLGFRYRQKPAAYTPTGRDTGDTIRLPSVLPVARPPTPPPRDVHPEDPPF
jgi:hypothetical protein